MRIVAAISSAISLFGVLSPTTNAFVNPALQSRVIQSVPTSTLLRDVVTEENAEETTTAVTVESSATTQQSSTDTTATNNGSTRYKSISQERINNAIKERPYPLFLAEKGAILFVDPNPTKSLPPPPSFNNDTQSKEKLVVLGTGWGAAAFLKNIDTNKYDVTVISPRNYFVFTPMLAGASVGTVDFKSITVPIRDVRLFFLQYILFCCAYHMFIYWWYIHIHKSLHSMFTNTISMLSFFFLSSFFISVSRLTETYAT